MNYTFQKEMRIDHPELMDEPGVSLKDLVKAHRELRIINRFLGGYDLLLSSMEEVETQASVTSVLDIGCGSGDNMRVLAEHYRHLDREVSFTGIDINPDAIALGKKLSSEYPEIEFATADVWKNFRKADVITCSLFCHHFNNDQIVQLINVLIDSADKAVVINDLHRHWFAFHSIGLLTSLFSGSTLVRHDAPLSVARSFSKEDWEYILRQCNFRRYTLKWKWAWRWQLIIYK